MIMRAGPELALIPGLYHVLHRGSRELLFARAANARALLLGIWLGCLGLLLPVAPALAQTAVSGAMAASAHWSVANSPYVVSGDFIVQNGAVLTIDAGVDVYMAAGASLTVQAGGIQALGSATQPIRVMSENTRLGKAAAPGDWRQWTFNPGTTNTRLDYVSFEHGSGIAINGSAPALNYLNVKNQQGAAISIDLAASPSGYGNQASGNTLNGIAVPAGDMTGSIKWALRGIPYIVAGGTVSVGATPTITAVTPNTIQSGQTATLTVTGTRLRGLTTARFNRAGLTAQILSGATDTQASLSVTVDSAGNVGPASLRLLADAGEATLANALTVAQVQPVLSSLAPASIYAGQGTVDLTLNGSNFSSQTTVLINSVAVPTQFVSATQLRASVTAPAAIGNLLVRLRTPDSLNAGQYLTSNELVLAATVPQLALAPSTASVVNGSSKTFTVTTPYAAPAGGLAFNLVASIPSVATVPATVVMAEGQTSATFQLNATGLGNTAVTASRTGFTSAQAQVNVVAPPTLAMTPGALTLGVGRTAEITVQSSVAAPASGLVVSLSASAPDTVTLPDTLTIPAGASTAKFVVSTRSIGSVTITAQATDYIAANASVNVRPVSLNMPSGALVAPSLARSIPITLSDPAPEGGLVINLVSSNPGVANVPASLSLAAGQTSANFTLSGVAVGTATVTASANNYLSAALPVTVDAIGISFGSPAVGSISVAEEHALTYPVALSRPAPAGGVVVNLAIADPSKATITPASISIPQGQTSGGTVQLSVKGVLRGSTTLSGSADGLTTATVPVTVQAKPQLVFSRSSLVVGKGLRTYVYEVALSRNSGASSYSPNEPVTVTLTSGDTDKVKVSSTVTIPASSASAYFYVTGVDLTNGAPVMIDASADGYTSPSTKMSTTVVAPVFSLGSLDSSRTPVSARDDFTINMSTPGSSYSGNQTAASDMPIDLSIIEANPSDIVSGFYNASTGGTPVNRIVMPAGSPYSSSFYVGTPSGPGSYKVVANAAGIASVTSATVTVTAPELKFSTGSVTVAKDFKTYLYEVYVYRAVNGASFNGAEALTVNLTSSDPAKATVPASVVIPANSASTYFYVTGTGVTAGTPITIDATATGYKAPATKLAVNVIQPVFNFYSMDTARSPSSARDDLSIGVTTPGSIYNGNQTAAFNLPVTLSIAEANPAGVVDGFYSAVTGGTPINSITIPAGSTGTTTFFVGTPTTAGSYKLNASTAGGANNSSALVTVTAPELKFTRSSVVVGKGFKTYSQEVAVQRVVNGNAFNGTDALTISLTSSDPSKVRVPDTVTIPANNSTVYFYVSGIDFTNGTPVTIDAAAVGHKAPTTKLSNTVVAPAFSFTSLDTNRSTASGRDEFYIYFTVPGAYYSSNQTAIADTQIDLSIVNAAPEGIIDGFFTALNGGAVTTKALLRQNDNTTSSAGYSYVGTPTAGGSYKVNASIPGVGSGVSGVVSVTSPELRFSRPSLVLGVGMNVYSQEVYVYRAANGTASAGSDPLTVNLTCNSTAICKVPASVTIPANQSYVYFLASGVGLGTTTITASAPGFNAPQDLPVTVIAPQISLSGPSNTRVAGTSGVTVYLNVPGAYYSGNASTTAPVTVNLTSSAPGVATVTPTVTVPTGYYWSSSGTLTGVSAGTTTVTASGSGLQSATSGVITISP
jgi:hypothetical protein